jgi:coatomer protein complex subunit alpha (xenin)
MSSYPRHLLFAVLPKFETHSYRVKGLSFHPNRPWILAALYNGTVQLWDWKMGVLLHQFTEHKGFYRIYYKFFIVFVGPVRAVAFHHSEPYFCTGGDDNDVRLWNYKRKICLQTFKGHTVWIA